MARLGAGKMMAVNAISLASGHPLADGGKSTPGFQRCAKLPRSAQPIR
jgi:hypothetical protein